MSNVSIEPGTEIFKETYVLRFAPNPEKKYIPKNYDEKFICAGLRLLSEGETEAGLRCLLIAWANENLWAGELLSYGYTANWFGENDYQKALQILYKMESRGSAMAMNNLGTMYMEGLGMKRSNRWAKYWFEKAVAHGCVYAMVNFANMLTLGPKKYRDFSKAIELLKMAMDKDDPEAFNMMGLCYHLGRGVPQIMLWLINIINSVMRKVPGLCPHIILVGVIIWAVELKRISISHRNCSRKPKKEDFLCRKS